MSPRCQEWVRLPRMSGRRGLEDQLGPSRGDSVLTDCSSLSLSPKLDPPRGKGQEACCPRRGSPEADGGESQELGFLSRTRAALAVGRVTGIFVCSGAGGGTQGFLHAEPPPQPSVRHSSSHRPQEANSLPLATSPLAGLLKALVLRLFRGGRLTP